MSLDGKSGGDCSSAVPHGSSAHRPIAGRMRLIAAVGSILVVAQTNGDLCGDTWFAIA